MKNKSIFLIAEIIILCLLLTSCWKPFGEREYYDDLYVDIPETESRLLIKEWQYLLGSGSEVYYLSSPDAEPQFLGEIIGGDDGYCPFNNGKYAVSYSNGSVTLTWSLDGSDNYTKSKSFVLEKSDN